MTKVYLCVYENVYVNVIAEHHVFECLYVCNKLERDSKLVSTNFVWCVIHKHFINIKLHPRFCFKLSRIQINTCNSKRINYDKDKN